MQSLNSLETAFPSNIVYESFENRVSALRTVVMLLMREVESLERSIFENRRTSEETSLCLAEKLEKIEIDIIRSALINTNGRQNRAAKLLGVKVSTLNAKIKKHNIDWSLPESEIKTVS